MINNYNFNYNIFYYVGLFFVKKYCIVLFIGNENKQMWFASYIRGGEAYDRNIIFISNNIHIVLCFNRNNYRCHCLNYSASSNFEQERINQKKTHL